MPLKQGCDRATVSENIRTLRREGRKQAQAVAVALKQCAKKASKSKTVHAGYDFALSVGRRLLVHGVAESRAVKLVNASSDLVEKGRRSGKTADAVARILLALY